MRILAVLLLVLAPPYGSYAIEGGIRGLAEQSMNTRVPFGKNIEFHCVNSWAYPQGNKCQYANREWEGRDVGQGHANGVLANCQNEAGCMVMCDMSCRTTRVQNVQAAEKRGKKDRTGKKGQPRGAEVGTPDADLPPIKVTINNKDPGKKKKKKRDREQDIGAASNVANRPGSPAFSAQGPDRPSWPPGPGAGGSGSRKSGGSRRGRRT